MAVADPGLRWEGQGAKCLVMALCLGPGGPKVFVWYIFSYARGAKLRLAGMAPVAPPGSTTE